MSQNTPPEPTWNPETSPAGASASEVPGQQPQQPRPVQEPAPAPQQAPPTDPKLDGHSSGPGAGVWAALIVGILVLIVLLIFILQNMEDATIHFMSWTSSMPTGVAMLLAAIAGALVMALVGSVRLFAVNRRVRKLEKERERIKSTLR